MTSARNFSHTLQIPPGTEISQYCYEMCKAGFCEVILSY